MKRLSLISVCLVAFAFSASAQKGMVGMRAPRIGGVEWISDRPALGGKALMVGFFHSSNSTCLKLIEPCNRLAAQESALLNIVVVTREPAEQVARLLLHDYQYFYVAIDERGKVFDSFGASYVPYAVIVDKGGTIVWTGNPANLTEQTVRKLLAK